MLFYMAVILPLLSLALLIFTYHAFKIMQTLDRRNVVKGESVVYTYEIHNLTPFLFCPMKIFFYGDQILFKKTELMQPIEVILQPGTLHRVSVEVDCVYRGSYFLGIEKIVIKDFFNLFALNFVNIEKQKILVYPLIREIKHLVIRNAVSEATESIISFDKFDSSLFADVRDYRAGDSFRSIHWKLSSKYNQLMTKEYEGNVNNKSKILINSDILPFTFEENIVIEEYVVEGAVALLKYLLENNTPIEMFWYKSEAKRIYGNKMKEFGKFYESLTQMIFGGTNFIQKVLIKEMELSRDNNNFIIFTPYIGKEMSEYLIRKKRQNCTIHVFIVDANNSEFTACINKMDGEPKYNLISHGVHVYRIIFENGMCRLEVA
ncbi:MAG: DUF58 domain-containing protein [Vallitaleaceae bacterium]|nr:DUF58 domain-containing protein [Vallitaleaceae bacterium]